MTAMHLLLHYVLDVFIFSIQFPILLFRYKYLLRLNFWRWRMTYHSIWLIGNLHAENGDSLNYEHAEKWVYMYVLLHERGEMEALTNKNVFLSWISYIKLIVHLFTKISNLPSRKAFCIQMKVWTLSTSFCRACQNYN